MEQFALIIEERNGKKHYLLKLYVFDKLVEIIELNHKQYRDLFFAIEYIEQVKKSNKE